MYYSLGYIYVINLIDFCPERSNPEENPEKTAT